MSRRMRRNIIAIIVRPASVDFFAVSWFQLLSHGALTPRAMDVAYSAEAVKGLRRTSINYAPDSGRYALAGHPCFGL